MNCTTCRSYSHLLCLAGLLLLLPRVADAGVIALEFWERKPFANGMPFGETGPYEILRGVARFAVQPAHPRNRRITDLSLAPRNPQGQVEFAADVCILAPKDRHKGNGALLYDVNNRGNKLALRFFNDAPGSNHPHSAADAGNGYLLRRGYTVVWCGWIGELLPGNDRLLLRAPVARGKDGPLRGLVRYEMVTERPVADMPLSQRDGHGSYAPTRKGEAEGLLTWRMHEKDKRIPIPNSQWHLERLPVPAVEQGVAGTLGQVRLHLAGGFRPGYLYELVCEAEGPIVQGLGLAAIRDLVSFLKYDSSEQNPCRGQDGKPVLPRTYGFGVSQSGRLLRHFVYEGFNADEQDRRVFDGLIPHVAGGGLGFFNHRFAQPTRHNAQHEEHLYPTDVFPFTYGESVDPFTKRKDGILRRLNADDPKFLPKIFHTQSAAEYWHRSGSLVHTEPSGQHDAAIPDHVRIYAFGGTQHGPASRPPGRGVADNLTNPGDYRPLLRALLDALDAWVRDGTEPPASRYPRIDTGTLVSWQQESTGFPALPGVRYPEVIQQPPFADYGPKFFTQKIITIEPPRVRGSYPVLVPKSDRDGNDLGTLLVPEVAVPLATYTGWNLRQRMFGAEADLASLQGSYIPFAATRSERLQSGDPRLSIAERYPSFEHYQRQYKAYCERLVNERYLLAEDAAHLKKDVAQLRELFPK